MTSFRQSERQQLVVLSTRRSFICQAARAVAGAAIGGAPLVTGCGRNADDKLAAVPASTQPSDSVPASPHFTDAVDVSRLETAGQWLVTPRAGPDGAPILIVRKSKSRYLALSMQCTHMGCPVNPPVHGVMTCPCHGSQFDLRGNVRHGPAQYPLGHYDARIDAVAKTLTISLG